VTVKTTRKNEKMAFFSIEDKYGEIECIAFSAQFARNASLITEDSAVCVEGNISLREDEDAKVLVTRIFELIENGEYEQRSAQTPQRSTKPDIAPKHKLSGAVSKLYLRVPNLKCAEFQKAKNLVDIFEGNVKVIFYDTSTSTYSSYENGIELSDYIYNEFISLLGKENVVPK
jgi:DNA polymerase-3 subunit alpha